MYREGANLIFEAKPVISSYASAVGKKEAEGPLRDSFDRIIYDSYAGKETFEQAESELMTIAVDTALKKTQLEPSAVDIAFCGDLLNQCVASSFAMRSYGIPYAGIYGACSTMGLGLIMSATAVESGAARRAVCAASSHYCTAERQYRFPLEYGSQRPPTAQWTVTGAGACVVENEPMFTSRSSEHDRYPTSCAPQNMTSIHEQTAESNESQSLPASSDQNRVYVPYISSARIGRITDLSITDQNNMGAAMAPAVVKLGTIFF